MYGANASKRRKSGLLIAVFVIALLALFWSRPVKAARDYESHSGYLESTVEEREAVFSDLEVVPQPMSDGPSLRERIFNEKLSKEFNDEYYEKFGRTEAERVYYSPNRFTYYNDAFGLRGSPQEVSDERKRFGEYMVRRLAEFHIDDYMKNDPSARTLYEIKERVSNVKVEVNQFKFDMQYGLAGNTFDMVVGNPWLSVAKLRLQMDPASFGPGQVDEMIITLGRPITQRIKVESYWAMTDGIVSLVGTRKLSETLSTTLTASTFTKETGTSTRESLYLSGVSYVF